MTPELLFLETVRDLSSRVSAAQSEYELLMAAPLMRKLLLDSACLVDVVNRRHRLKLAFTVADDSKYRAVVFEDKPTFWAQGDGLDPLVNGRFPPLTLGRDQFMAHVVMVHAGTDVSVADLVRVAANVLGGVHLGTARTPAQQAVADLGRQISIGGCQPAVRSLKGIGGVVVSGLAPLVQAVQAAIDPRDAR